MTVHVAWVALIISILTLIISILSLVISYLSYRLARGVSIRQRQEKLRSDVRQNIELYRNRIDSIGKAAAAGETKNGFPLELDTNLIERVKRDRGRFTRKAIPDAVAAVEQPAERLRLAVDEYNKYAQQRHRVGLGDSRARDLTIQMKRALKEVGDRVGPVQEAVQHVFDVLDDEERKP